MIVSVIITTRNRAQHLRLTLEAFRPVVVPDGAKAELVVVDNGSADDTAEVVKAAPAGALSVRYVHEPRPGQCHARNRGLAETCGESILFADDDVRPPPDWIAGMCQPMVDHGPCGVAGGVRLAPALCRPWMTRMHRSWLASTEWLDADRPRGMVGANMGFSRAIVDRVPAFDTELGPGALGFGDDQLFASQVLQAGFRIFGRPAVSVEHHFEPKRLLRASWLQAARGRGRSHAYRGHHWEHWRSRWLRARIAQAGCRLFTWRLLHGRQPAEGISQRELELAFQYFLLRAHLDESRRPRNYQHRGLVKGPSAVDADARPNASPLTAAIK